MLNGVAPIIIFHFYNKDLTSSLSGLPFGDSLTSLVGLPIPIYLDEQLTGIYVDSETSGIDFITEVEPVLDKDATTGEPKTPLVKQTALDSTVSINLFAKRDSVLLTAFLALSNMILKRAVSQEYGITYLNRSTTIFNGLMHRFSTSVNASDDLLQIELTLSNAKQETTKPPTPEPETISNTATTSLLTPPGA